MFVFFFKQKTAYEMRISDWSSDVCSSDLSGSQTMTMHRPPHPGEILREDVIAPLGLSVTGAADRLAMSRVALSRVLKGQAGVRPDLAVRLEIGRASCRERVCQYV